MIASGVIKKYTAITEIPGDPAYKTALYSLQFAGKYTEYLMRIGPCIILIFE